MRGSRKPIQLHIAEGNPAHFTKAEIAKRQRCSVDPELPQCPADVKGEARKLFKKLATKLHKQGLVCSLDAIALGFYCDAVVSYEQAKQGSNPRMMIAYADLVHKLGLQFGLTPLAREKLPGKEKKPEGISSFARERSG